MRFPGSKTVHDYHEPGNALYCEPGFTVFTGWIRPLLRNSLTWAKYHEPDSANYNKHTANAICDTPRELCMAIIGEKIISNFRCHETWNISHHICNRHNNWCILRSNIIWIALFTFQNKWNSWKYDSLRQVSGIKYLNQMSTYHLACGDSEIT